MLESIGECWRVLEWDGVGWRGLESVGNIGEYERELESVGECWRSE